MPVTIHCFHWSLLSLRLPQCVLGGGDRQPMNLEAHCLLPRRRALTPCCRRLR